MAVADPVTEVRSTFQQSPVVTRPRVGVVLHHAATTSADQVIQMETTGSREVSSNRVVKDARCVKIANDPEFRAWSLADARWDSVLSSVECANESTNGWTISAASHETLARQVAWWAQRDGFTPHRNGDPHGWTVFGHREIYAIFGDSYSTACPGGMNLDWVANRAREILAGGAGLTPEQKEEAELVAAADTIIQTVSANVRRDSRARLYRHGANGPFVAIDWDQDPSSPSRILWANDPNNGGLNQIQKWYALQIIGDTPQQAIVCDDGLWNTLLDLARGTDTANKPNAATFPREAKVES